MPAQTHSDFRVKCLTVVGFYKILDRFNRNAPTSDFMKISSAVKQSEGRTQRAIIIRSLQECEGNQKRNKYIRTNIISHVHFV
jgi:hypothetical protein